MRERPIGRSLVSFPRVGAIGSHVGGVMRVDLIGRTHGGIATPHVQTYGLHTNPTTGAARLSLESVRAATMEDLRAVRRYLDRQP